MKKTEKIEVRVSLEEKERLGKMAEKRGQSVSDMIRERMSEDVSAIPKQIRMNRFVSWLALSCAVVGLLWVSVFNSKPSETSFPVMSTIHLSSHDSDHRLSIFNLPHLNDYNEKRVFSTLGYNYEFNFGVQAKDKGVFLLTTRICKKIDDVCVEIKEHENILSPPSQNYTSSKFSYDGEEDERIHISILGPGLGERVEPES